MAIEVGLKKPSECDVVVVVLWSRMGTKLEHEGKRYHSGTHYEFEDALGQAKLTNGKPMVLLYRRIQKPQIDIDDSEFELKREQYRLVCQFFESMRNSDGSIRCAAETYETPGDFVIKLDRHLQHFAKRQLDGAQQSRATGLTGVVAAVREAFRGFEGKPSVEKVRDLAALRRRIDAVDDRVIATASEEVKALLELLAREWPEVDEVASLPIGE